MEQRGRLVAIGLATILGTGVLAGAGPAGAGPAGAGLPRASASPDSAAAATGFGSNWPTYHQNGLSAGVDPAGTDLSPLSPAWTSPALTGTLFGEPLVENGRVFVATEDDDVYALAADTGAVLWSHHLATAVPDADIPCGDISPSVGVTGTPVIDASRSELFVVADELSATGHPAHHLYGLNLLTGKVELDQVVDPPGSTPGAQLQRPGLALDDGYVIIGFGSNAGDCTTSGYSGWLASVPVGGGVMHTFEMDDDPTGTPQTGTQGSVWMGGAAPVVDAQGNVWVSTGNGPATSVNNPYGYSDSVLDLSPTLGLEQYFAPSRWETDNAGDDDLGSTNPTLVGNQVFIVGKDRVAYLLNRQDLGGIGGDLATMQLCGTGTGSNYSENPFGGTAVDGTTVYVPCRTGLTAVAIGDDPPSMTKLWTVTDGGWAAPIVAGGLVWTLGGGTLYGVDPTTGHTELTVVVGSSNNHFPTPTVADGLLLVPTVDQVTALQGPAGLPPAPSTTPPAATSYRVAGADGGIFAFGGATYAGSMGGRHLNSPIVGLAATPDGQGYWLVGADGGIFAFGDAPYEGSMGGRHLNSPIVGLAATPDGQGYWLVGADGGIFAFGDAPYEGSMGGRHLNSPIVGLAPTPDGQGYWLVGADGGIFAFGDAPYEGSMGGRHLNSPIVGLAPTLDGQGYWLVGADGGIFGLGDAAYLGSTGGQKLSAPITGVAATPDGAGYWLVGRDGAVYNFGDAAASGSLAGMPLAAPVVALAGS